MIVKFSIADIDAQLSESGQFSIPEWWLAQNLLPYAQYEAWRYGELNTLQDALNWDKEQLLAFAREVETACKNLKLEAETLEYVSWGGKQQALKFSADSTLHNACSRVWRRPEDMPQLDLFMDNSAVVGENTLQQDLAAREFARAEASLKRLTNLNSSNPRLGAYQDLLNYGQHMQAVTAISALEAYDAELMGLVQEVAPLAKETLKTRSRDYLAFAWRRLATNAPGVDNNNWQHHGAYAFSQIPDWAAVQEALRADELTYQQPELLALYANACFYGAEPQLGYCVWGQIAERFPEFAERSIGKHEHAKKHLLLTELWDSFLAFDEHWPAQWFLGYLLITRPGLVHLFDTLPERDGGVIKSSVNQITAQLVKAKIDDADQKLLRAQLKSAAPALLKYFMNKRDWYAR